MTDQEILQAMSKMLAEADFATKEDIERVGRETRAVIENKYDEIAKLLKEDYGRVSMAVAETADYPQVREKVNELDHAVQNHEQRLESLEKKAI